MDDPGQALREFFSSGTTISLFVVLIVASFVLYRLRRTLMSSDDEPLGEDLTIDQARRMRQRGQIDDAELELLKHEIARRSKEQLDRRTKSGDSSED